MTEFNDLNYITGPSTNLPPITNRDSSDNPANAAPGHVGVQPQEIGPVIPLSQIEEILDAHNDCFKAEARDSWRALVGRNPEQAKKLFDSVRLGREQKRARAISNRVSEILKTERISTSQAWERAKAEIP